MSKELFVTSTPHETKLAVVEDDQVVEVFFERENEYTLAGSIYKGRVTRVLPGMQSSFVDIGLERDAFLYITDFMEEAGDSADFEAEGSQRGRRDNRDRGSREPVTLEGAPAGEERSPERSDRGDRGRDRGGRGRRDRRDRGGNRERQPETEYASASDAIEPAYPAAESYSPEEPIEERQADSPD